jgi:hypothetical protein
MWIAHAFIHARWCSNAISLHSKEIVPSLMPPWHHHTILYPHLIVVA